MKKSISIQIVEDEEDIAQLICFNLSLDGYKTAVSPSGRAALDDITADKDLILLDIMIPEVNGFEVCKKLKSSPETKDIPIIILSAKDSEQDIVTGLELGADDYITKPFSPKVLKAKVKATLRRTQKKPIATNEPLSLGSLTIDPQKHKVTTEGNEISLTPSEFDLLLVLMQKPGWVFTRSQIVNAIRGESYAITERTIDFLMVGLRKKLKEEGKRIETVRGVGYRFQEQIT